MATREENLKKINEKLEKLSDEQLENVVGGSCTAYFFLYEKGDDGKIHYLKDPIKADYTVNPFDFINTNAKILQDAIAGNLAQVSDNVPTGMYQDFANKNAWQFWDMDTWGNLVFAADIKNVTWNMYTAQ